MVGEGKPRLRTYRKMQNIFYIIIGIIYEDEIMP